MTKTLFHVAGARHLAVAVLMLTAGLAVRAALDGTEVSRDRIDLIENLTNQVLDERGLEADEQVVVRRVREQFFEARPDCPSGTDLPPAVTVEECQRQARELTDRVVQAEFGDLDREKLEAEARELYPTYEIGDVVEVVFQLNPARRERVRGVFSGRSPRSIQIGRWQIMVEDLVSVNGDDSDPALRFNQTKSRELREEYVNEKVTEFEEKREKYRKRVLVVARREKFQAGAETNEERGYTFWDGEWIPTSTAIQSIVRDVWDRRLEEREQQQIARVNAIREDVASMVVAEMAAMNLAPNSLNEDPDAEYAQLMEAVDEERQRRENRQRAGQEDGEDAGTAEEAPEAGPPDEDEGADAAQETAADDEAEAVGGGLPIGFLIILGVFAMVTVAGVAFYMRQRSMRKPESFFKGKGRMQKNFWSMAEADPENFKYVAYIFPTMEDAQDALGSLSFIHETPDGQLTCPHDIMYGFYPHQGKYVSFVGGVGLHYALWREASAVMPELPGAEYFRVSTAPDVLLEIPDIEALLRDENLQITHVANREGEGDDYSQYYMYRAPDKENALEFLRRARVDESGVHVLVETPQGVWGKDENGIYQE